MTGAGELDQDREERKNKNKKPPKTTRKPNAKKPQNHPTTLKD
jgi:hypothetical protein